MAFLEELNSILESAENYQAGLEGVYENVEEPDVDTFLKVACVESAEEIYKLQGSLLIADVKLDQSLLESTITEEQAETVMEATVKEYFNKAVNVLVKMKNATMEFITNLINFLRAKTTDSYEFVNKNFDLLKNKKGKYNMHEFTISKGDMVVDKALKDAQRFMGPNGEIAKSPQQADDLTGKHSGFKDPNTTAKNMGHANVGQLIQSVQDAYMSKEKKEITFDCMAFMNVVRGKNSGIDAINKQKNEIAKTYDGAISMIKAYASKVGQGEGNNQSRINKMIAACRAELSVCNKLIAKKKEVLTLQHSECLAALRSVLSSSDVKSEIKKDKADAKAAKKAEKEEAKAAKKAEKDSKKDSVNESFMDDYKLENFMSLLED